MGSNSINLEREGIPDICKELGEASVLKLHLLEYSRGLQRIMHSPGRVASELLEDDFSFVNPMLQYTDKLNAIVQDFQKDMAMLIFEITDEISNINQDQALNQYPEYVEFVNSYEELSL